MPIGRTRLGQGEEWGQDALGQPPDGAVGKLVRRKGESVPAEVKRDFALDGRVAQQAKWYPECLGHLLAQRDQGALGEQEDMGVDHDQVSEWRAGRHRVEDADELVSFQPHSDFFRRLPHCRHQEIGVRR